MKCEEARELFIELIDNSLPPFMRKDLENHLTACAQCQQLFENYQQLLSELGELKSEPPFWVKIKLNNIFLQLPEEKPQRKKNVFQILMNKWVVAVAAMLIVLMNLFYFTNIFPPANRGMRTLLASAEALICKAEGFFEQVKDSGNFIWLTIFGKTLFAENRFQSDKNIDRRPQGG